jgi:hypothetical protein
VGAPLFGVVARVKRAAEVANGDELVSMAIVEGAVPASVGKNEKEIGPSIGGGGVRHGACSIVVEVRPLAARLQRRRVARAEDTRVCREGGGSGQRRSLVGRLLWTWPDEQYGFSFNSNFQTNLNLQWFKTYLPLL